MRKNKKVTLSSSEKAYKRSKIFNYISIFCWVGSGTMVISMFSSYFSFSEMGFAIFLYAFLALVFKYLSRKALQESKKINHDTDQYNNQLTSHKQILNEHINPELNIKIIGNNFAMKIEKVNKLIRNETITNDLHTMNACIRDIFEAAEDEKIIEEQIRKFSNIYLPLTLKLLNIYIDLDDKHMHTSEIEAIKTKIVQSISDTKRAFVRLNDELFKQESLDIEAEIITLSRLLSIDGLLNKVELKIPEKIDNSLN